MNYFAVQSFQNGSKQQKNSFEEENLLKIQYKVKSYDLINNPLTMDQIIWLISKATDIFKAQPIVLYLQSPIKIIGDLYGHYKELTKISQLCLYSGQNNFLFLGNYVGRGQNSLQTLFHLLYYKIKYPLNTFLLRGKHQVAENNRIYGLYQQCERKYNLKIWILINQMFNYLPLCAVIEKKIFCVSSGLSQKMKNIGTIQKLHRPLKMKINQFSFDLLNSKFKNEMNYLDQNDVFFDQKDVNEWNKAHKFNLIVCSNQIIQNGFQFSTDKQILSICSVPNLLGLCNLGAILCVQQQLRCSFMMIKMPLKSSS